MEMEALAPSAAGSTVASVLCCECGASIAPNPTNMCIGCLRSRVDITEGITRSGQLYLCQDCQRYQQPPAAWIPAAPESKELMSVCLKRLKAALARVRLVDAVFVWTEPHSKRVKVKVTVQKEVLAGAILQQSFVVEFVVYNQASALLVDLDSSMQMCDDCRRAEAKDFWRACVQVRQRCEFKKTLFYLEQLILKHGAQANTTGIRPVATGIDFFYPKLQDARKLVEFITAVLPCKHQYAQELMSHDTKNNTYDYKHTFCVDIVPICRDSVVCLPRRFAQQLGNMNQVVVCLRVSNVVTLIDPATAQTADVTSDLYWRNPFDMLCERRGMTQWYVIDAEVINDLDRGAGHGHVSRRHSLADLWLVKADEVGRQDAQQVSARTHLGNLIKPGDTVLGFDVRNCNVNNRVFDEIPVDRLPDVVVVKKVFDRSALHKRRQWKLRRMDINMPDTASVENEFQGFLEDLDEDPVYRQTVNIYKDAQRVTMKVDADDEDEKMTEDGDLPEPPTLQEMLDDLDLDRKESQEGDEVMDGQ